ncbi:MAG TPA: hypothetical protein VMD74_03050, partial [Candidatus Methylomirabilis sp.]|nr:hypothetical protein [Candidatus Methylomirabilis sp.]
QFNQEAVLLAVAGERRAKFYIAESGEIDLVAEIEELVPKYDDNEGFFGGKKGGKLSRMGSPSAEVRKEYLLNKFTRKFEEKVAEAEAGKNNMPIYLFAPAFIHNLLAKSLPKAMTKRIKKNIAGNYLHATPFELIGLIDKNVVGGKLVNNEKARKLLKK